MTTASPNSPIRSFTRSSFRGCALGFAAEDARVAEDVFADADEAVDLGPEVVGFVETLDDADDRVGCDGVLLDLRDLADRAERLAEVHQLLDALEHVERLQLARTARLADLELLQEALATLLGAPVERLARAAAAENVVEDARDTALFNRLR